MGLGAAWGKWKATSAMAAGAPDRAHLRRMFLRRYHYPGFPLLRALCGGVGEGAVTVALGPTLGGLRIDMRPGDIGDVASFFENFVEQDMAWIPPGFSPRVMLDAGAHIGCFSLLMRARFPSLVVHALEPSPANAAILRTNFQQNGIPGQVHEAAIWRERATLEFATGASNAGALVTGGGAPAQATVAVQALAITDVLDAGELARLDLVKLDIEGAELEVLPGLLEAIPARCLVYAELHDADRTQSAFDGIVARAGFSARRVGAYPPHLMYVIQKS